MKKLAVLILITVLSALEIGQARVLLTLVDGRPVYTAEELGESS